MRRRSAPRSSVTALPCGIFRQEGLPRFYRKCWAMREWLQSGSICVGMSRGSKQERAMRTRKKTAHTLHARSQPEMLEASYSHTPTRLQHRCVSGRNIRTRDRSASKRTAEAKTRNRPSCPGSSPVLRLDTCLGNAQKNQSLVSRGGERTSVKREGGRAPEKTLTGERMGREAKQGVQVREERDRRSPPSSR